MSYIKSLIIALVATLQEYQANKTWREEKNESRADEERRKEWEKWN